ncbi:MAG: glycosyltransferase family 2 protein [Bacteroidetes bacterium]|nr:glycosyltransferase family 2 protein [Bacteroidota bacterium]
MFFSIVIPTHNRAAIIQETLYTVLSQSFNDYEIIVVDDGSTDNTGEVIKQFKNSKIKYFYKENEERSIARNFGADKAAGDYLIFLDSDDKMKEDHLLSIYEFVQKQKSIPKFIFAGYIILNPDKSPLYEYGVGGFFPATKLFYGNFLGCSSIIVEKDLFKKYYFNIHKGLILFEDWELWLRIIAENKLYCFPGKSIVMINHGGRSVLNYGAMQINDKILHFKNHILKTSRVIKNSFFHRSTFLMGIYSYAALHIAMTKKNPMIAFKYLCLSLINNPMILFKRRFFGVIKHLF